MSRVRANRAYIAGFGTAGSLLAGAAVLFVLASAVVSFRGWPQVGDQSPPTAVVVARASAHAGSTATRRVIAVAAAQAAAVTGPAVSRTGGAGTQAAGAPAAGATVSASPLGAQPGG